MMSLWFFENISFSSISFIQRDPLITRSESEAIDFCDPGKSPVANKLKKSSSTSLRKETNPIAETEGKVQNKMKQDWSIYLASCQRWEIGQRWWADAAIATPSRHPLADVPKVEIVGGAFGRDNFEQNLQIGLAREPICNRLFKGSANGALFRMR